MAIFRKIIFLILVFLNFFLTSKIYSEEVKILFKLNNDIITNIDVENEYSYLTALNPSLNNIKRSEVLELAKRSIVKEMIKKKELIKFYELNQKNDTLDAMVRNIYQDIGLNSEEEFKKYLKDLELNFEDIYKKIEIETVWNQLIYTKFKDKVIIDEKKLKEKISNTESEIESFLLYEIVYDYKNKEELSKKYQNIIESINSVGFDETVIKFSISNSKNKFGLIGWVKKNTLSNKIRKEVEILKKGQISNPIIVPSGILILKLEDKKIENIRIDLDEELENLIKFEMNRQLNNYSTIYFNKIKNNLNINEY